MRKNYFLGLAANYSREERLAHTFTIGREEDVKDLKNYLNRKYLGERTILTKNGRSALALALKAYFNKGDKILVNGFTCYAVYEAIKAANLEPVFVDINLKDLNFDYNVLDEIIKSDNSRHAPSRPSSRGSGAPTAPVVADGLESSDSHNFLQTRIKGIIIQNTLGNPVDIEKIEKFAKEHDIKIIEDLAHSAGVRYSDGREAGTVGIATVLSFGKDKSIDTISGGAVIFRQPYKNIIKAPSKAPKISDHIRARLYPTFGAMTRALTHIHLGGIFMRILLKLHLVEKSADNKLDLDRKISKFEAKRALIQIKSLSRSGEKPLRDFEFVNQRTELLTKLAQNGFYFDGFWYEKPVSPARYYKKVLFPEKSCPNAVYASEHIINIPKIYHKKNIEPARKIISEYLDK